MCLERDNGQLEDDKGCILDANRFLKMQTRRDYYMTNQISLRGFIAFDIDLLLVLNTELS